MDRIQMTKLRKLLGFAASAAFLIVLFTVSAAAQGKQDFTLHNQTGRTISEVYVSPNAVDEWEEDVMGSEDVLANGESVDISFNRTEKANYWDIKVIFSDGKFAVWTKLNLSQITDVTISFKGGKPWATWKNGG